MPITKWVPSIAALEPAVSLVFWSFVFATALLIVYKVVSALCDSTTKALAIKRVEPYLSRLEEVMCNQMLPESMRIAAMVCTAAILSETTPIVNQTSATTGTVSNADKKNK